MPAALISKEVVLSRILERFRDQGYDGASLAELSAATGLGKSSLYHYFPGGKSDMAEQVLAHLDALLQAALFEPLQRAATPQKKLDAMLSAVDAFYEGGKRACLLERLTASVDRREFKRPLAAAFMKWMNAVEELAREAGLPKATARARAEKLVVAVEGALIVSAGIDDAGPFKRTLAELRRSTLAPTRTH